MKLTAEMIPLLRSYRGLSQCEFAEYSGIPQARLSDIECKKISISAHYSWKLFLAIGKLKFNEKEIQHITELAKLQRGDK